MRVRHPPARPWRRRVAAGMGMRRKAPVVNSVEVIGLWLSFPNNSFMVSTPPQTENSLVTLDVNRPPVEDHYGYIALEIRRVCATCR